MGVGNRFLVLALVIVCTSHRVCSKAPLHLTSPESRVEGHYIVVLKDDVDVNSFSSAFEDSVLRGVSEGTISDKYHHAINGFSAKLSKNTLQKLLDSDHVKYIEEDGIVTILAVPAWGQGRVDQRNLPLNSNYPRFLGNGGNTHVYVIDTGTLYSHIEFSGRTGAGYDDLSTSIGADCHGHGTHVGGIAVGKTYGIADMAMLHSVRVLDCTGSGLTSDVIAGMDWVIANALRPAVASISVGGGASSSNNAAVARMTAAGIVVVVAAGNNGLDACNYSPGSAPSAITVGASLWDDSRVSWSNYGNCVDIWAPGVSIKSSYVSYNSAVAWWSGTSMSCPHVSGAAAILLGKDSTLSPQDVADTLFDGATQGKISDTRSTANRLLYIGTETCMTRCGISGGGNTCSCDGGCTSRNDCCYDYSNVCGSKRMLRDRPHPRPTRDGPDPTAGGTDQPIHIPPFVPE